MSPLSQKRSEIQRARLQPHAGLLLAVGVVVMMGMSPFIAELLDRGPFGIAVFVLGVLVSIAGIGGAAGMILEIWWRARQDVAIRAEVWDERAQFNHYRAMSLGYISMYLLGLPMLVLHDWWKIPAYWAVFTLVAAGLLSSAVRLFVLERRDNA